LGRIPFKKVVSDAGKWFKPGGGSVCS